MALHLAGVTSKAYAEQHGLSVHSLRHWVGRFKSDPTMAGGPDSGAFVALRLERSASAGAITSAPSGCTLRFAAGWELQMPGLPSPQWLAGLSSALSQVR